MATRVFFGHQFRWIGGRRSRSLAQTAGDKGLELLSQASAKDVEIQVETG